MGRMRVLAAIVGAVLLAACSAGDLPSGAAPQRPAVPVGADEVGSVEGVPQAQPERKLTYSADVELRARDPWAAAESARRIPTDLGGDVLSIVQSGGTEMRSARLVLRVPAPKFDEAMERLRKLDVEVMSSMVDTKDVTEQFVDLRARLASKQREEEQYRTLLSQARSVEDTLRVTQALARTRTEVEQLQGQLNALTGRIDYSRITVRITNVADITTASAWQPARTAAQALVALVSLLKLLGDTVIWALIVGWVPALLLWLFVRARRWWRRRFPAPPPPSPAPIAPPP